MGSMLLRAILRALAIYFSGIVIVICISGWSLLDLFFAKKVESPPGSKQWIDEKTKEISAQAENINAEVLKVGLIAYVNAQDKGITSSQLLTIIDYSKPSIERRLWVIDLKKTKVLFNTWVSHGKNSGKINPTSFSNQIGSLKSSIGVFQTTGAPYFGMYGYSLRLIGLENGINDKALERYIVFHGASYVHPDVIKKYGFLGRSWGCPAVSEETVRPLINTIKDKSLVVMYYPDRNWINNSSFLTS